MTDEQLRVLRLFTRMQGPIKVYRCGHFGDSPHTTQDNVAVRQLIDLKLAVGIQGGYALTEKGIKVYEQLEGVV